MGFKLAIHVGRRSGSQCFSATNFVSPMYDKRLHYLHGMKHSKYKVTLPHHLPVSVSTSGEEQKYSV